jgi:5-methylcytosine-specific restriction endonuclease McrA
MSEIERLKRELENEKRLFKMKQDDWMEVCKGNDALRCRMCGRKAPEVVLHIDHIRPVSRGGLTEERNLMTLCRDCNIGKSNLCITIQ